MTQTIVNLGTGGAVLNGRNGSTTGADSNDALFLDWPGDNGANYVYLPSGDGNNMSIPDSAALDITGDIDLRVYLAADDWSPASPNQVVMSKLGGPGQSWAFLINSTGFLTFGWSVDGASTSYKTSTAALTVTDGQPLWIRATLDVDNGASGNDTKFFRSDDAVTWTQLGATITTAGITSIAATSENISINGYFGANDGVGGKFYRAEIYNGINGALVLSVDTSLIASASAQSFTAATGQTVTINRSVAGLKSCVVTSPVWVFGADDFIEIQNNTLINFSAAQSFTVLLAARVWPTQTNFGRYTSKTAASAPGWEVLSDATTLQDSAGITDGTNAVNVFQKFTKTGGAVTVFGMVVNRSTNTLATTQNGVLSTTSSITSVGSTVNSNVLRIGRRSGTLVGYQQFELVGYSLFRRALSPSELSLISSYYSTRWL